MDCVPKHVVLILMLLICGSLNTIFTKWADETKACGVDQSQTCDQPRKFNHPFVQAVAMFIGEFLCIIAFGVFRCWISRSDSNEAVPKLAISKCFLFVVPAICDMVGTTIIYIGLNLTYASSFQMLRGSVIIFTALLSVAFNNRVIQPFMWFGMIVIIFGLILVGLADIVFSVNTNNTDINGVIAGDLLIILAQVISATQFVIEEKYINRYNAPPLLVVGLEGIFGAIILGLLLIPMYFIKAAPPFSADPDGRLENVFDAFIQMGNNWQIIVAMIGSILSIALFNFSGISITKEMNATTRMVLDSGRTIIIWAFTLAIGWQPFGYKSFLLQLAGFVLLVTGMLIYNDILFTPFLRKHNLIETRLYRGQDDFNPTPNPDQNNIDENTSLLRQESRPS